MVTVSILGTCVNIRTIQRIYDRKCVINSWAASTAPFLPVCFSSSCKALSEVMHIAKEKCEMC